MPSLHFRVMIRQIALSVFRGGVTLLRPVTPLTLPPGE